MTGVPNRQKIFVTKALAMLLAVLSGIATASLHFIKESVKTTILVLPKAINGKFSMMSTNNTSNGNSGAVGCNSLFLTVEPNF